MRQFEDGQRVGFFVHSFRATVVQAEEYRGRWLYLVDAGFNAFWVPGDQIYVVNAVPAGA